MSIHRTHLTGAALALLLAGTGVACGGSRAQSKAPATAAAAPIPPGARTSAAAAGAARPTPAPATHPATGEAQNEGGDANEQGEGEEGDAELVVSRDVVARCPTLRLVREHVDEFDPDMVWLAVLESIADCMGENGTMSTQNIGVSGDEEHRHVVREVLGSRGVSPTRVVAKPTSAAGAAECQGGGTDCGRRVEITIIPQ